MDTRKAVQAKAKAALQLLTDLSIEPVSGIWMVKTLVYKCVTHISSTYMYSLWVTHERSVVCDVPEVARLLSRDSIASCSAASAADPSSTLPRVAPMAPLCPLLGYGSPLGLDSASCKLFDPAGVSDEGCDWCSDKELWAAAWSARKMAL